MKTREDTRAAHRAHVQEVVHVTTEFQRVAGALVIDCRDVEYLLDGTSSPNFTPHEAEEALFYIAQAEAELIKLSQRISKGHLALAARLGAAS